MPPSAATALDENGPRVLRIAGAASEVRGHRHRTLWAAGVGSLGLPIRLTLIVAPQPRATFPPWQGMHDMFSGRGKLRPFDNDRYPGLRWISVREQPNRPAPSTRNDLMCCGVAASPPADRRGLPGDCRAKRLVVAVSI